MSHTSALVSHSMPGLDGHSANLMGDNLIVYGGKSSPTTMNEWVYCLNLTTKKWQRVLCGGETPPGRAFHSAIAFGWKLIVYGGALAVSTDDVHFNMYNAFAHVDALDGATLRKRGSNRLREPRSLPNVTTRKLENGCLYSLNLEDQPSWSQQVTYGIVPPPRSHHAATVFRSSMYIYGGYSTHTTGRATDEELKAVYTVYALNLHTSTWSVIEAVESIPPKIWGMSSVLCGDIWLMFGGVDITMCAESNAVCAWHMVQGEWRWLPASESSPPALNMHRAVRFGDKMLVFGGSSDVCSCDFNELYAFDTLQGSWGRVQTSGVAPPPRHGHSMCIIGTSLVVIGGLDHTLQRSSTVWFLDLKHFAWTQWQTRYDSEDLLNVLGITSTSIHSPRSVRDHGIQASPTPDRGGSMIAPSSVATEDIYRIPTSSEHGIADDDVAFSMRTDVSKTKGALGRLITDAANRAEMEVELHDDGDNTEENLLRQETDPADEVRGALKSELVARSQRLRDLAQSATLSPSAMESTNHYWKSELDSLSRESETWRGYNREQQAKFQEHEDAELFKKNQRALSSRSTHLGADTISAVPVPVASKIHQPLKFTTKGQPMYVSPSLQKLQLTDQLGKHRKVHRDQQ